MRTSLIGAGLVALSSLIACTAAPDDGVGATEQHATEARTLGIVKGRELARCWFDLVGENQQLSCTSTARGSDPLKLTVRAVVTGNNGIAKQLDVEAGGTVVVGAFAANSFPRDVEIQAYMDWDARGMLDSDEGEWEISVLTADPSTINPSSPLVLTEPFDFWEIGTVFDIHEGGGYSFTAHPYKRDITPYTAGLVGKKELTFEPEISTSAPKTKFIVAPKEAGPLPVTWSHDGKKIETSIAGPGYYALTDTGIRPATPEEILENYGTEKPSTTEPTNTSGGTNTSGTTTEPTPEPQPEPTPEPEPSWVDPDPTCGGAGQSRCAADRSCDPGTRYDFSSSCIACGEAGKTYCLVDPKGSDSSQGKKCNPGTRFDFLNSCIACGAAGQTYCLADPNGVNSSQGKRCDAGTRFDFLNSCIACGAAGQTYCLVDANGADSSQGKKCNPGTRFDFSNSCIACGGAGQTYCLVDPNGADSSQGKKCNDGLRVVGNTCVE